MTDDELAAHVRDHAEPDDGPKALGCLLVLAGLVYLTAGAGLLYWLGCL
jgi:hypothetical protein